MMNREGLRSVLRSEGVEDEAYVLEGDQYSDDLGKHPRAYTGVYVLRIVEGGWAVFGYERGEKLNETQFETEDEACQELLSRVRRDPTTRGTSRREDG
jgi:hypothetical protein